MDKIYKLLFALLAVVIACHANIDTYASSREGSFNKYFIYTPDETRYGFEVDLTNITTAVEVLGEDRNISVIVHGQSGSVTTSLNPSVKDAFFEHADVNVIIVDWSLYASLGYTSASHAVPSVGTFLANFLTQLIEAEVTELNRIHLVGFDLGAHVVGFTSRTLGRVARITGLNPSGNLWANNPQRLDKSDAVYVEVVHTDGDGILGNGIRTAIGHVDFYVNGGNDQPGCFLNRWCSHNRSWDVFGATLTHNHLIGNLCGSWLQVSLNTCRGRTLNMGNNDYVKLGTGMYRVNTKRTYPF